MAAAARLLASAVVLFLLTTPIEATDHLDCRDSLSRGSYLQNGAFKLIMQDDCNLVIYDNGKPVWHTNTAGRGVNCRLTMQCDANLVVYTEYNRSVWASGTAVNYEGFFVLVLKKDGSLVIYGGRSIWQVGPFNGIRVVGVDESATSVAAKKTTVAANRKISQVVVRGSAV